MDSWVDKPNKGISKHTGKMYYNVAYAGNILSFRKKNAPSYAPISLI